MNLTNQVSIVMHGQLKDSDDFRTACLVIKDNGSKEIRVYDSVEEPRLKYSDLPVDSAIDLNRVRSVVGFDSLHTNIEAGGKGVSVLLRINRNENKMALNLPAFLQLDEMPFNEMNVLVSLNGRLGSYADFVGIITDVMSLTLYFATTDLKQCNALADAKDLDVSVNTLWPWYEKWLSQLAGVMAASIRKSVVMINPDLLEAFEVPDSFLKQA